MFQSWRDVLFAHWRVPYSELRPLVPAELELEHHSGSCWVGLTPLRLTQLRTRWLPPVPGLSQFPELNLRTYVRVDDKPGIFFFSLDVASLLTVLGARLLYGLPYYLARMQIDKVGDRWFAHRSERSSTRAEFAACYRAKGPPFHPEEGTLEHFLIERYALYSVTRERKIQRGDIHHARWSVQPAEAAIFRNTVASASGILLPGVPCLLHYAARQDTVVWPPVRVR